MNEIKHIHLGRQQFTISVAAYSELKQYIEAIARQAGDASSDMTEEVESRMAELLNERGLTGDKVVLPKDVAFLRAQLGEPREFNDGDTERNESVESANDGSKRLFRDTDDAMIAGVASGLGKYLGIDATIVRLIFIALTLFGGSGVLVYIILWLLVPEAKTNSDRLQMDGLAVNIENIKHTVDRADVPGATRRAGKNVSKLLGAITRILSYFTGVMLVMTGVFTFVAGAVTLVYGLVRGFQLAGATVFPKNVEQTTILISAVVVVGLLAGLLVVSGLSLVRKKWIMPGWAVAAMVGVFIVATSVGGGLTADSSRAIQQQYQSIHHTRHIAIKPFTKLNFIANNTFYITEPGATSEVQIRSLGNVDTSAIKVSEKDGVLTVDTSKFNPSPQCDIICPYGVTNAEIVITTPDGGQNTPIQADPGSYIQLRNMDPLPLKSE